jgi:glutathione S-transferase
MDSNDKSATKHSSDKDHSALKRQGSPLAHESTKKTKMTDDTPKQPQETVKMDLTPTGTPSKQLSNLQLSGKKDTDSKDAHHSKLTLYMSNVDGYSAAVAFLLNTNKIQYETVTINLYKGDQNTVEFKKINPLGKVPTIAEDEDFVLYESCTIMRYICNSKPVDDHWYPKDPVKRSLVDLYFDWHGANMENINKVAFAQFQNKSAEDIEAAKKVTAAAFKQLEDVFLQKHKFLASNDQITIADLALAWHVLMGMSGGNLNDVGQKVKDWYDNVRKYPGIQEKLDTYEKDLKAMMGRMAAAKQLGASGSKPHADEKTVTPTK